MHIGGFVSSAGGLDKAIVRATENNFDSAMFFIGSPQTFKMPTLTDEDVSSYQQKLKGSNISSTYAHALYLANLATPDNKLFYSSVSALTKTMQNGEAIKLNGVIFHLGSHKGTSSKEGLDRVIKGIKKILDTSPGNTKLLLENAVGQGDKVGVTFKELGYVLDAFTNEPRVGVCIDTCHAFAMGYDFSNQSLFEKMLEEINSHIGFDRLDCFHLNDSQGELNSHIDRHANILEGHIGKEGFERILSEPHFASKPFILEVPGVDGNGPAAKDRQTVLDLL
ncbi:deoxyribonuclease IV [bacterium]|uniref:Probable endonuclease 4 n=2 Tax=Katanobacteria TaxID=422282 RepID=A0A2M7X2T9_UNCKA|nr:deoxyribonuclease IV [bacterium]PIP56810.1 MAG: hypothetical protein COX05_01075 [candidate division WWE3 bacterium CG22_combo_CG10-13_8_21_14_all_39_12]PJA40485.1 MAG: hypothetical protein CO179_02150 [candidate division WWE3 bacterium CG_4_9_14_3_um_filter_39_7]